MRGTAIVLYLDALKLAINPQRSPHPGAGSAHGEGSDDAGGQAQERQLARLSGHELAIGGESGLGVEQPPGKRTFPMVEEALVRQTDAVAALKRAS